MCMKGIGRTILQSPSKALIEGMGTIKIIYSSKQVQNGLRALSFKRWKIFLFGCGIACRNVYCFWSMKQLGYVSTRDLHAIFWLKTGASALPLEHANTKLMEGN